MVDYRSISDYRLIDPGWSEVLAFIESIPDSPTCGGGQPSLLFALSHNCSGKGVVVEIGSFAGSSSIALAYGQKVRGGSPIFAVDCRFREDIEDNLQKVGLFDWVTLLHGRSSHIARTWKKPIEFLFIDGDHSFLGCRNDIRCWAPHVIVGGIVVFHDYSNWGFEGVHWAVKRELLSKPREWQTVADREVGSLYVVKRIAEAEHVPKLTFRRWLGEAKSSYIWLLGELGISQFAKPMQGGKKRK